MNLLYLFLNLIILAGPLLLSIDKRVNYYKKWRSVGIAILFVSIPMIFWDVHAHAAGHWFFNPKYTTGIKLFTLPIEEILFFATVPFSCLFIWEVIRYFQKTETTYHQLKILWTIVGAALIVGGFVAGAQQYTAWVSFICGSVIIAINYNSQLLQRKSTLLYLGVTGILFLVFNTLLTALPVVTYGESMISGVRIGTIPIEDAVYNVAMLLGYLAIYARVLDSKSS